VRFFVIVLGILASFNVVGWVFLGSLSRRSRWKYLLHFFFLAQVIGLIVLLGGRWSDSGLDRLLPKFAVTGLFIWQMIGLPLVVATGLLSLPFLIARAIAGLLRSAKPASPNPDQAGARREFLAAAAAIVPPLFTISLSAIALRQLEQFRVRRFNLAIEDLPQDLHGLTIAQVSDMHVGRFTSGPVLRRMVDVVNNLKADLVLLTGDLINDALADLDAGIELVRAMDPHAGLYLIEGNHDLIENPAEFERRMRASGIPFLLDQSTIVQVRGVPVQLLGLRWTRVHQNRDTEIAKDVRNLLTQRVPDTFPILLAHHPHAFDEAAAAGLPLTLSGHTHGGQLMWNDQTGFGPALFRYWSGLYTRGSSQLIVSNGVGNWFPLRVNAPAEIVHVTLVRA
jgi:predicted MPP superfamily phosphohydrolase